MSPLLHAIVISLSLGAMIGLIRQWAEQQAQTRDEFAGVRTFAMWSLLGAISAAASSRYSAAVFAITLGLVGLHVMLPQVLRGKVEQPGYTTLAAALLTCLIGGLVHWGELQAAVVLTASTMVLLGSKQPIHALTRRFTEQDIRTALLFVAISGVILPLVPNRGYGPYEAINPSSVWRMVVLINGLGFVGYILMRLLGAKAGTLLTGVVGGLASSTMTTLAFSRRSRDQPAMSADCATAIVMACTVMLVRVAVVIAALNREILATVWPHLAAMALPGIALGAWALFDLRGAGDRLATPDLTNPLRLRTAIKFAGLYSVITLLVKVTADSQAATGLMLVSFISGLTDVDAVVLSSLDSVRGGAMDTGLATRVIVMAVIANTLLKAIMSAALGSAQLRNRVSLALGLTMAVGIAALLWLG